jgi:hypothetical protein
MNKSIKAIRSPWIRLTIAAIPCLALNALPGGAAIAHHSFAMFDSNKCRYLTGTVRKFSWNYPHSWLWVDVPNKTGGVDAWGFEGEPPSNLAQDGWTRTSVVKGDKILVGYNPLRDGRNGGSFSAVKRSDGKVLTGALGKREVCTPKT